MGIGINLSLTEIALHDDIWKIIQWSLESFEEYIKDLWVVTVYT